MVDLQRSLQSLMKRISPRERSVPSSRSTPIGATAEQSTTTVQPAQILDAYTADAPSPQNAADIFKGEWSSQLPDLASGAAGLFADPRLTWASDQLGGFGGKHVLELGPLEAGHTYMLEKSEAASVTAVEANSRAYLKCLLVKELYGLQRAKFLYGDFCEYLRGQPPRFDVCVASGVLYHMKNPVELIDLISRTTDKVFLWTHYYDEENISQRAEPLKKKFTGRTEVGHNGFTHVQNRYEYQAALNWNGFCGGSASFCNWLTKHDIVGGLKYFGFDRIEIGFDDLNHPNGPSFSVAASRTSPASAKST